MTGTVESAPPAPAVTMHVVVVDDDPDVVELTRETLEDAGFVVDTYLDLDDALDLLPDRQGPFVLVLDNDFNRPDGLRGWHLAERLRREHPWGSRLPIIYLTATMDTDEFADLVRDRGPFAPTFIALKGGHHGRPLDIVAEVNRALEQFADLHRVDTAQHLRRAVSRWSQR